jgi:hypothetical protein
VCDGGDKADWATSNMFTTLSSSLQDDGQSRNADQNIDQQVELSIYPNPAQNFVNIDVVSEQEMNQIQLFDMTGRLIQKVRNIDATKHQLRFNADLPAGMYILRIEGKDFSEMKQIVVQ